MVKNIIPSHAALALQGGGAHGAFTWGALDQLLLDGRVKPTAISAVSTGALQAVVLADGWLRGGPEEARASLHALWKKISTAAGMLPFRTSVVDKLLSHVGIDFSPSSLALETLTHIFSPYQFNLFDLNPLRSIIEEMVDFERLQRNKELALFITCTQVKTGEARVFSTKDITLEVVMASCCHPFIFKTVMIGDEPFWDGSFTACPALSPLFAPALGVTDIALIRSHPVFSEDIPTLSADILDRSLEIAYQCAATLELNALAEFNKHAEKKMHLHTIESDTILASEGRASKLNFDWDFLAYLHDLGVQSAVDWLEEQPQAARG